MGPGRVRLFIQSGSPNFLDVVANFFFQRRAVARPSRRHRPGRTGQNAYSRLLSQLGMFHGGRRRENGMASDVRAWRP